jgi:hypothetical protein
VVVGDELGVLVGEDVSVKVDVGEPEGEFEADDVPVRVGVGEGVCDSVMLGLVVGEVLDVDEKDGVMKFVVVNEGDIFFECVAVYEAEGDTVEETLCVGVPVTEEVIVGEFDGVPDGVVVRVVVRVGVEVPNAKKEGVNATINTNAETTKKYIVCISKKEI